MDAKHDSGGIDYEKVDEFFNAMFESSGKADKMYIIPAVCPSPRIAGGNVMWRRKKRFAKKRAKWLAEMHALSHQRFYVDSGLEEYVANNASMWQT